MTLRSVLISNGHEVQLYRSADLFGLKITTKWSQRRMSTLNKPTTLFADDIDFLEAAFHPCSFSGRFFGYFTPFPHVFRTLYEACQIITRCYLWSKYTDHATCQMQHFKLYFFFLFSFSLPKLHMAKNSRIFFILSIVIVSSLPRSEANPMQEALDSVHCVVRGYTFAVKVIYLLINSL